MRVLVAGSRQVDAGKTTFTRGLIASTGAPAYKPRAANNRWYDYDAYRQALDAGVLYGKDARLLAAAHGSTVAPETINPIHRLWQPIPDPTGGIHEQPYRQFMLDRVGDTYVRNANAELPAELEAALPLAATETVGSLREMNDTVERRYLPTIERWENRVNDDPVAIVESYGDIAMPVQAVEFDIVAAVEPGRVRFFEGRRYGRAATAIPRTPREGTMEPVVEDVIAEIRCLGEADLPPLAADVRQEDESIADAYGEAYDTLLDLVPEA